MKRRWRQIQIRLAQAICAYRGHGRIYRRQDEMAVFCSRCGFQSSGVSWVTHRVLMLWKHDKQRRRFQAIERSMQRTQKAS